MSRYALVLEYDGSYFCGWQKQLGVATIQSSLEKALANFASHEINTITAGRTDTGVHALNQVVHFDSSANRQLAGWIYAVNAKLPAAVRVKKALVVEDDFDARYSAVSRTYQYYLYISPQNSAHLHSQIGWYYKELDLVKMQLAAALLVGQHDFSSFRAAGCQANSAIRTILQSVVEQGGNMIRFTFQADAFLDHMIRNIVGALVYVGNGRISVDDFANIFAAGDRKLAPPTFMPNGLYLASVDYPCEVCQFDQDLWLYSL